MIKNHKYSTKKKTVLKNLIEMSKLPYCIDAKSLYCQVSIGLACYPESGDEISTLMRHVDLALYQAKKAGNQYAYFSRALQEAFIYRQQLEQDIIQAFNNQELYIVLQPKVCAKTDSIIGAEALLRWHQPKRQRASLFEVIKTIQSMGLSGKLNHYVVKKVLDELKNYPAYSKLNIAINISPSVYQLEKNIAECIAMINESKLNTQYQFYFEITETSLKDKHLNIKSGSKIDQLLKSSKIGLSLDDFGIEHSSINRLFECNFSIIKIDMSFIQKLETEESKAAKIVIKSVIDIACGLEMQVVAEGAETKAQVDILKKLGCNMIQGYFYYRPMAMESFFKAMKEQN